MDSKAKRVADNFPDSFKAIFAERLPKEPGEYIDDEGNDWKLDAQGRWHDRLGHYEAAEYNFILGFMGIEFTKKES